MTIGERIKRRRMQLNMSVDELAEKLGKNRATVYRYEKDEIRDMPTTVLEPLANALCTTPADLMGWEDPPAKPADAFDLSAEEKAIITAYRTASTDIKNATCAVLGVKRDPGIEEDADYLDA